MGHYQANMMFVSGAFLVIGALCVFAINDKKK
jgi:hypothetical protein